VKMPAFVTRLVDRFRRPASAPKRRSAFAGAQTNRLTLDWVLTPIASADQEQRSDLRALRGRARELVRNTAVGARYPQLVATNVIGPGVLLRAKNYTTEGVLHKRANDAIEVAWSEWSRAGTCTMDGRLSLTEALDLLVRSRVTDGEVLIELVNGEAAGNGWGFAFQQLDPDLLDETLNRNSGVGINEIRQGVEIDRFGRPVAYWLYERHPNDVGSSNRQPPRRVSADRIIHWYRHRRAGQTRGVTDFAPVMMDLRMLAGYYEAELVAARVASAKMGFIEVDPEIGALDGSTEPGVQQNRAMDADPGSFLQGKPGEKLQMFNPEHPVAAFRDFTTSVLHHIASGLGTSYGTLTGDLSQANYSSMRVGMLAERDIWRREQQQLASRVLDRLYAAWLPMAILSGNIPAISASEAARWMRCEWRFRGFPWVDPQKDIDAGLTEVAAGVETLTSLAAESGRDLEDILEERQKELALLKQYGVESVLAPTAKTASAPADQVSTDTTTTATAGGRAMTLVRHVAHR